MKIFGISAVRNEADIIGLAVLHHLRLDLDRIIVIDNGSTDGTKRILQEIAKTDDRLHWFSDERIFDQAGTATELAREAFRQGADWIVPFDADEFWWIQGGMDFRELLTRSSAGALRSVPVNFVQARHRVNHSPDAVLNATYRAYETVPSSNLARQLLETHKIGLAQITPVAKHVSRPTADIEIGRGNHTVEGIKGETHKDDNLLCLHIPLRSRALLESKMERSQRLTEAGTLQGASHVWHWAHEISRGNLEKEWAANSHEDGQLDVYGEKYKLLFDPRLKKVVRPLIEHAASIYDEVRATREAS